MEGESKKTSKEEPEPMRAAIVRGWIIVGGIALLFVLYGLFAFFVIGDNQPADWDFGAVKDVPGESVYSTYPYRGGTEEPEAQHVNRKPPNALAEPLESVSSEPLEGKPKSGKLQRGGRK